jgi:LmbE family N-acetylglucosaminyl deacetylase
MRVCAIVAHPDDEVLGPGGTLIGHADRGDEVAVLILGEGFASRGGPQDKVDRAIKELRRAAEKAAEVMGVSRLDLHNLPDNRFDTVPLLEVTKSVEAFVLDFQPQVIYTHHGDDLNLDHQITSRAVLTALRPLPEAFWREILFFETASSTEYNARDAARAFVPNVWVDVSAALDRKVAALAAYESEIREYPHPRSREGVVLAARERGMRVGLPAAEAFYQVRRLIRWS